MGNKTNAPAARFDHRRNAAMVRKVPADKYLIKVRLYKPACLHAYDKDDNHMNLRTIVSDPPFLTMCYAQNLMTARPGSNSELLDPVLQGDPLAISGKRFAQPSLRLSACAHLTGPKTIPNPVSGSGSARFSRNSAPRPASSGAPVYGYIAFRHRPRTLYSHPSGR